MSGSQVSCDGAFKNGGFAVVTIHCLVVSLLLLHGWLSAATRGRRRDKNVLSALRMKCDEKSCVQGTEYWD